MINYKKKFLVLNMQFKNIELPSNKSFGLFFSFIFAIAFLYFFQKQYEVFKFLFLILSALFLIISLTKPKILLPLNKAWMFLGFIISKIISPIVLGVLFFMLITPVALFIKIIGRDELNLNKNKSKTFWKVKETIKNYTIFFDNQF
mgnify:CR=1 FL=1